MKSNANWFVLSELHVCGPLSVICGPLSVVFSSPAGAKQFEVNLTAVGGLQTTDELSWKRRGFHFFTNITLLRSSFRRTDY